MAQWNAVISVHEHGFKKAFSLFSEFGRVKRTEFFNVLMMQAEDLGGMLETLRSRQERTPDELAFLARVVPVERTFLFTSKKEFESKAREAVLGWSRELSGRRFHVRIRRRGFKGRITSPDEERMLDEALLDSLQSGGSPGRIDFEHPDAIVAIETIGTWAGASLIRKEEMEKYRFIRV